MINGNHNTGYDLICDICGYTVTGLDDFEEARDYAKENGWKTEKYTGAWENYCPKCQEG
jgi:Fe2+ or Zn2+ uptake regulation protein